MQMHKTKAKNYPQGTRAQIPSFCYEGQRAKKATRHFGLTKMLAEGSPFSPGGRMSIGGVEFLLGAYTVFGVRKEEEWGCPMGIGALY